MQLQITPTDVGFRLAGELDMATADDLGQLLDTGSTNGNPVVLECSGVSFMDSSGLRVLLKRAGQKNGQGVVIKDPSPQVRRLLDISLPGGAPGLEVHG